jgi:hypothetical protein
MKRLLISQQVFKQWIPNIHCFPCMSIFTNCGNLVLCPQFFIWVFGCMWKESVAPVTTGLRLLRAGIYDIQSLYFCNKLYFMPNVCLVKEQTMFCVWGYQQWIHAFSPSPFSLGMFFVKCITFKDVIQWMARCGCRCKCFYFRGECYSVVSFFVLTTNIFTSTIKKSDFNFITVTVLLFWLLVYFLAWQIWSFFVF